MIPAKAIRNLKISATGILLYLALQVAVILPFMVRIPGLGTALPITHLLAGSSTLLFGGAFLVQTMEKAAMRHLSIAAAFLYLSVTAFIWPKGGKITEEVDVFLFTLVFFAIVWLIAGLGIVAAKLAQKRWPSLRARRIRMAFSAALPLVTLALLSLFNWGSTAVSGMRAGRPTPPTLHCNAAELRKTKIVPTTQAPVAKGTNLLWCATFQMAWNEMEDLVGEKIRLSGNEPAVVQQLNARKIEAGETEPETCLALAGPYTRKFVERLNNQLDTRFGPGAFGKESLPPASNQEAGIAAFAYININLPFKYAFQRADQPLDFGGTKVEAFTLPFGAGSEIRRKRAKRQVRVRYPPDEGGVIVELLTKNRDHHLILARVSPEATLGETVEKVVRYEKTLPPQSLSVNQRLLVPLLNLEVRKHFAELEGKTLALENSPYRDWTIQRAEQTIRFQLDERGAVLSSSAVTVCVFCAPPVHCIFDRPFLLMLRHGDAERPYFAMWVDNAEILVKSQPED